MARLPQLGLSEADIIERGHRAARLLGDAVFLGAIDDLSDYHLAALVAAPPGEQGREAREYHHLLHYALSELGGQIQGYVDTGLVAEARQQALESED